MRKEGKKIAGNSKKRKKKKRKKRRKEGRKEGRKIESMKGRKNKEWLET